MAALVHGHGVILNAQGITGSPASVGFGVDEAIARNCTLIAPCQLDTTIIRETEIEANIVNLCGRTQLLGNIDIAIHTEDALAAQRVTQVTAGSEIQITIHQVNADGAGPYACDIDEGSNSSIMEKQLVMLSNVPGINGLSQTVTQDFNITAKLPDDVRCTGGSTGNICTVRCRNNAIAGPFGGCFPIQQVDVQPTTNTPQNIPSFKDLPGVLKQVEGNLRDLDAAIQALAREGTQEVKDNQEAGNALLRASAISRQYPTMTQLVPPVATTLVTSVATSFNTTPLTTAQPTSQPTEGLKPSLSFPLVPRSFIA
ncbi:hypothetical protein B0I35DRAFT_482002 [Stachybotrys elegans]|uniref:Uncharacterized protein n=1 Tax=Stachybotrys elegans TaxID=80388 RepID=A0A8K0SKH6_9HYPO|nr:hypothetical protein B0I35DRAFT_482002 [Stachybotrys elegans]